MAWSKDCPKTPGIYGWRSGAYIKKKIIRVFWYQPPYGESAELRSQVYGSAGTMVIQEGCGEWWDEPLEFPWKEENEP